ncbi:hypothetical protein [Janthinobacterium sp. NKUCC06_STL]|uniref:hypothetical protein n=1 Tax=Janthinobacterium sp. NKUCC06_STL TaxID=2842127 RepID=UPI0035A97355|nr:hypothetical protein [Janthinobacterium sp. NKUCC06_STL]
MNLTLIGTDAVNATGNALDGAQGADTMAGGAGDDIYFVDHAADVVLEKTDEGMDAVYSTVNYTLDEHVENLDLAAGAASGVGNALDNRLTGNSGANLLSGGADDDTLKGGAGNDIIHTGRGADIIAFNRGGGRDTILASAGKGNTVSMANGIVYTDLLFTKSGNDLVLETGAKEQLTFKDWYADADHHSVANLQIVVKGGADYDGASANRLNNRKVAQFDFDGLAAAFDRSRIANPALTSWGLSSSLLEFYLGSSDTAAIGGDLTYQYARNGNLSAVSLAPAQALLISPQFGLANQNLQAASVLQDNSPRLQ